MSTETYNGWTNYATWRVNLELCDGHYDGADPEEIPEDVFEFAESIKETVTDFVCGDGDTMAQQYAGAFLSDVNWYEIAKNILDS